MGVCCCISLKKAVITVGLISALTSSVLTVMNLVHVATFEEHIRSCRLDMELDILKVYPSCSELTDASVLLAARIFSYLLLLVWVGEIISSILLIVAAVKGRTNLMIPWVVLSILVVLTLSWEIYQASLAGKMTQLALHTISLAVIVYFLIIVRAFAVQIRKRNVKRCCQSGRSFVSHLQDHGFMPEHIYSDPLQDYKNFTSSGRPSCSSIGSTFYCNEHPIITKLPPLEVFRNLTGGSITVPITSTSSVVSASDTPPAYTPFTVEDKGPLPRGLGVRH